jgi:hypothetical protein
MSEPTRNRPFAVLKAVIEESYQKGDKTISRTRFEEIAAFWPSQNSDNLSGQITCEPIEWGDPRFPRRVVLCYQTQGPA